MDSVVQALYLTYESMEDKGKKEFLSYVKDNYNKDTYELLMHMIEFYNYL